MRHELVQQTKQLQRLILSPQMQQALHLLQLPIQELSSLVTEELSLNPLLEFLYWHMNWHTEHHMYAGVPCYNLRELHLEVKDDMPEPRTLVGAWREMLDTWGKQQVDPGYQFDTPLPATAKTERSRQQDTSESSIGDLAPKGLS